jgi:hypothetical protein
MVGKIYPGSQKRSISSMGSLEDRLRCCDVKYDTRYVGGFMWPNSGQSLPSISCSNSSTKGSVNWISVKAMDDLQTQMERACVSAS